MQAPKLEKIVVNIGIGEAIQNAKALDAATSDLQQITGQKPITKKAKNKITVIHSPNSPQTDDATIYRL